MLTQYGIAFEEIKIDEIPETREFIMSEGHRTVPQIYHNGKLFVGPHLIVGLAMTSIIAIAAALSPLMQKGNDFARYTHIVLNIVLVGLFGWQAVTGMDIVQRIISKL